MRRLSLVLSIASIALLSACEDGSDVLVIDGSGSVHVVDNNADDGEGSLRAALDAANTDPLVNTIQIEAGVGTVNLASTLNYFGEQPLRILGNGAVIDGTSCGCDLFVSSGGADLDLVNLTLTEGERGLFVSIPGGRSGTVSVRLDGITVEDNGLHGVHIDDRSSASSAGIHLDVESSVFRRNGFKAGVSDYDGIRVEEGGAGDLSIAVRGTDALDNAGDGIELAESGTGTVFLDIRDSDFANNGAQPQAPGAPEDGLHVRESGSGSIDARVVSSGADGNRAHGILMEEEGAGDIRGALTAVAASNNGRENVVLREDVEAEGGGAPGAGGISMTLSGVTAQGSDLGGAAVVEFGAGDLTAQILDSDFSRNDGSGLTVSQGGTGKGTLHLIRVTTDGNGGSPVVTQGTAVTEGDDQTALVRVRNDEDEGFGSLRAALEQANQDDGIAEVLFESGIGPIEIESTLEFSGTQDLRITAQGALIDAEDCDCDALVVSGSGKLTLEGVSIEDAAGNGVMVTGGGDVTLRNLILRDMEGNGLLVAVDEDAEGLVNVVLEGILVENNGLHGIFVDDLAPVSGSGTGANSQAGIVLEIAGSTIQGNGHRPDVTDRDGVRVEEGGLGDIDLQIRNSVISANQGDGVQVREEGLGAVNTVVENSRVDGNGRQTQNPGEPEDGLEVAELGPGGVRVRLFETFLTGNFARGFGLTEEGSGDVSVTMEGLEAVGNGEETVAITEDEDARNTPSGGGGSLFLSFTRVTLTGGGADGILMEEFGTGDLTGQVVDAAIRGHTGNGIDATQTGAGSGQLQLVRVTMSGNGAGNIVTDGVGVATVPAG